MDRTDGGSGPVSLSASRCFIIVGGSIHLRAIRAPKSLSGQNNIYLVPTISEEVQTPSLSEFPSQTSDESFHNQH